MKLPFVVAIVSAFLGAIIFGGITFLRSSGDIALSKGVVFMVSFGIIGWGSGYIILFLKPELRGRETVRRQVENVDYIFPDEEDEED